MQGQRKVLIIDDEIDLCILLRSYFLRKNFEVFIAHNLSTGLDMLERTQPGILFIDNNLPDGYGWEQVPQIALKHPKVIFNLLSAFHPSPPQIPQHINYTLIEKPISFADLDKRNWDEESLV